MGTVVESRIWYNSTSSLSADMRRDQLDLDLLALTLYHEARGQPDSGLIAIGEVIFNRVRHPAWPDTVRGVIRQPAQFSFFKDMKDLTMYEYKQKRRVYRIASKLLSGDYAPVVGEGAYHYYNPKKASPNWKHYRFIANVSDHRFLGLR